MNSMTALHLAHSGESLDALERVSIASTCGDLIEVTGSVIEDRALVSISGPDGHDLKDFTPAAAIRLGQALIAAARSARRQLEQEQNR